MEILMFRFENVFEATNVDQNDLKSTEKLNAAIQAAQKCLTHGDFHKYREAYQESYDNILHDMLVFTDAYLYKGNGNIEMYAMKILQYMQRIQDLRILLNKVNID